MRILLLFLALSWASPFVFSQEDTYCKIIEGEHHAASQLMNFRTSGQSEGYDVIHHTLELEVDPAVHYIKGAITTDLEVKDDVLEQLVFDLTDNMTVDSVLYQDSLLGFSHSDNLITINLPNALTFGQLASIQVFYQGAPSSAGGFGSFVTDSHNGMPVLWTLSEPYGARNWWPCKQDLVDKIDSVDIIVTCPVGNKVGSNGLLINETVSGNQVTYHWKHTYPIPVYLVAFAVTNYVEYTDTIQTDSGTIEMLNYCYPEDLTHFKEGTQNLVSVMHLFNDLFGMYPYWKEKYGHAQFSWGGGMEHTTMTFTVHAGHGLLAHELAHQWFGDAVTCGSWEDIWLNEGFATYLEAMTYEHGLGSVSFENVMQDRMNIVMGLPGGSVWIPDTTDVNRIFSGRLSYYKGSIVLHMLRWVVGDHHFFQGVRNYFYDPNIHMGFAKTPDLIAHMEAQSGMDLTEFFDDWFYGEGYPIYTIETSQDQDLQLHITINQTQSIGTADYFELPVPLRLVGDGLDTIVRLDNTVDGETFTIDLDQPVEDVLFNPGPWILGQATINHAPVATTSVDISHQVSLSPNPVNDLLTLQVDDLDIIAVDIIDLTGKRIRSSRTSFSDRIDLDVADLPSGQYVCRLMTKDGQGVIPFMKE